MSIYDTLFEKDYGKWTQELKKYETNLKQICNVIDKKILSCKEIYPRKKDLFKFLEMTPLDKTKVVIWGQDPYPTLLDDGNPRAQGYSFGVKKGDKIPQSLKNIYTEMKNNFPSFQEPDHGDLNWLAEQGVLFMNQSLCFSPENPKLFLNLWNRFTYIIITIINNNVENCIHLLWGKQCEPLAEHIKSREIYITSHPSPFSVRRGFFGCKHFLKVNITLERQEKDQINWNENKSLVPTHTSNL